MSPPLKEKTLAAIYNLHLKRRSGKKIYRKKLNHSAMTGPVITKHETEGTHGEEEGNSSGNNSMVEVKVEKEEEALLLETLGIKKRKQLSRRFRESSSKEKQPRVTTRWNNERIKFAEQTLEEVMKEKGASFETPVSRQLLRVTTRKIIGDTGLLDYSLKHIDGKVTPGGADRFRRCYNTDGTMQYWLESVDLVKIKLESGIPDPTWVPPSWWKVQSASHGSTKLLMGEIEQMKSDIKELASKQKLQDHADANEKLYKDFMSWRVKTDEQIMKISNSLTSTQSMFKELILWKDKVEHKLAGISTSLNNLQPNGSTSFSPEPENWEHILKNTSLDDFTGNGFAPWDDLIDSLPDAVGLDIYALPPNPCKRSFQDNTVFEEQSLVNIHTQTTERSSSQDKAEMTPGSSTTADPKSEIDDPTILSQETLKELVTWKAKVEQQLTEISNAVLALKGQNQINRRYP